MISDFLLYDQVIFKNKIDPDVVMEYSRREKLGFNEYMRKPTTYSRSSLEIKSVFSFNSSR